MPSPAELEARRRRPADVPCNGCTACCSHDRVVLGPDDDPRAFRWHVEDGYAVVDRRANGDCIYLSPAGCSIHGAAPMICRRMDCRVLYAITPPEVRRMREAQNPQMAEVYRAGAARLDTLEEESITPPRRCDPPTRY